jgi:prepilin-type N-terminal cleavage/methylation domain-containing protein
MSRRRGVTLVEVLVVIGIVAVLAALALPAILRVRGSGAKASCQNNLRDQAVAALAFEAAQLRLPPAAIGGPFEAMAVPAGVSHGMYACLAGYLGLASLAPEYRWDRNFDAEENQPVARSWMPSLACPGAPDRGMLAVFEEDEQGQPLRYSHGSDYGAVQPGAIFADLGWSEPGINFAGALEGNGLTRLTDIRDGAAQTIMLGESGNRAAAWVSPATAAAAREVFPGGRPGNAPHLAGFHVAFCDGAARFLPWTMNPRVFAALCTRAGGEAVSVEGLEVTAPKAKAAAKGKSDTGDGP